MIAVGIDISKAKSTVAVIDSDGTVLAGPFIEQSIPYSSIKEYPYMKIAVSLFRKDFEESQPLAY